MKYFVGRPALSGSLGGYAMVTLFALKLRVGCCVGIAAEVIMRYPLASMDRVRQQGEIREASWRSLALGCGVFWCRLGVKFWGPEAEKSALRVLWPWVSPFPMTLGVAASEGERASVPEEGGTVSPGRAADAPEGRVLLRAGGQEPSGSASVPHP